VLEPGDMLYLPPGWAHDGIAEGEGCMTCSIGFRAPRGSELAADIAERLAERGANDLPASSERDALYRDPRSRATGRPGRIPRELQDFAARAVRRFAERPQEIAAALGELLTEPKADVSFPNPSARWSSGAVALDRRTRMMYDAAHVFINGDSFRASGRDARLMRRLADERRLDGAAVAGASRVARALLREWFEAGWLRRAR
jgi:50S ribosomal protein L16 3-hydroxylase